MDKAILLLTFILDFYLSIQHISTPCLFREKIKILSLQTIRRLSDINLPSRHATLKSG